MNTVQITTGYEVVGRSGVVEAVPATSHSQHTPVCCQCEPKHGLSICGNCGDQVDIYIHRDAGVPDDVALAALRIVGNRVKEGGHVK